MTRPSHQERGIALISALSVLVLVSAASLAFVIATSTENRTVTSERVEQAALWNADAGIEVARQVVSVFARGKLDSLAQQWAGAGPIITDPDGFFPGRAMVYVSPDSSYQVTTALTFADSAIASRSQTFNFNYASTAEGRYAQHGRKRVVAEGVLRVSASRGAFTDYLIFTHIHTTETGSPIWFYTSGNFDGRVHTNGQFRFAYFPTFHDLASSVSATGIYYNNGTPVDLNDDHNGSIDVPSFNGGFQRGADPIEMPPNAFGQQRAAFGGNPADTSPVTNQEVRGHLGLPISSDPVPSGVYVPNAGGAVAGGIYTAGTAREMRLSVDGSGRQVVQVQDTNSRWTAITIDQAQNRTTVVFNGGPPATYLGVPRGVSYTAGEITRFGGPVRSNGQSPPALAQNTQLTVVASSNIRIDRDVVYQNFDSGSAVLGLYSSGASVKIRTEAPNELLIDGYVFANGPTGVFTVESYYSGSYRGQVHMRGGVVQRYYGAFGTFSQNSQTGYGRDWHYDRRGIVPPYYPSTMRFRVDEPSPLTTAWREE